MAERERAHPSVLSGVIVESGSNPNGEWRKFEDGTMICWHTVTIGFNSAADLEGVWTFPQPFTDTPNLPNAQGTLRAISWSGFFSELLAPYLGSGRSTTSTNVFLSRVAARTNFVNGDTAQIDCFAIGTYDNL